MKCPCVSGELLLSVASLLSLSLRLGLNKNLSRAVNLNGHLKSSQPAAAPSPAAPNTGPPRDNSIIVRDAALNSDNLIYISKLPSFV